MATIRDDLDALERHIRALSKAAANKVPEAKMQEGFGILDKLAQKIKSPNQSKNETYYGLGAPDVYEVGDAPPKVETAKLASEVSDLAYDTFQTNSALAQQILAKAEETVEKIDKLAKAGRKFNAARAKADVHAVASKVSGILHDTELTEKWVHEDLQKLAARADKLHGLFAPAKA